MIQTAHFPRGVAPRHRRIVARHTTTALSSQRSTPPWQSSTVAGRSKGTLVGLDSGRLPEDDQQVSEADGTEVTTVAVCNGQYAGGGMRFGPEARLTDGQLDVVIIRPSSLLNQLRHTPKLYQGKLKGVASVSQHRGRHIQVEPLSDRPAYIEFDGEAPGMAPAEFSILPAALPVLGLQPWAI